MKLSEIPLPKAWDLAYWQTGEWQVIQERLEDEVEYNPPRCDLFAGLRAVLPDSCRVAIYGQDPYPTRGIGTGVAFSTRAELGLNLPPTLVNIFKEYQDDLHYPPPKSGDLTPWCEQGVLLWNVYPSCKVGKPGSHHWEEWTYLTKEITEKLNAKGVVFVLLGRIAQAYDRFIDDGKSILTSHPSPLGAAHGFMGSRIFSKVNDKLISLGKEPINWKLPCMGEGNGKPQRSDNEPSRG